MPLVPPHISSYLSLARCRPLIAAFSMGRSCNACSQVCEIGIDALSSDIKVQAACRGRGGHKRACRGRGKESGSGIFWKCGGIHLESLHLVEMKLLHSACRPVAARPWLVVIYWGSMQVATRLISTTRTMQVAARLISTEHLPRAQKEPAYVTMLFVCEVPCLQTCI